MEEEDGGPDAGAIRMRDVYRKGGALFLSLPVSGEGSAFPDLLYDDECGHDDPEGDHDPEQDGVPVHSEPPPFLLQSLKRPPTPVLALGAALQSTLTSSLTICP